MKDYKQDFTIYTRKPHKGKRTIAAVYRTQLTTSAPT